MLRTLDDALTLLAQLGAPTHLLRHHALVAEAADQLIAGLSELVSHFDAEEVLLGAALHDVGKILHPAEMRGPGTCHEEAGRTLLEVQGHPSSPGFVSRMGSGTTMRSRSRTFWSPSPTSCGRASGS